MTEARLKVLAVDDERPALSELTYLLERAEGVAAVTAAGSAGEALQLLQDGEFDAVFLDIHMPGLDGLALARLLKRFAVPPPVVFVTAYDTHAVAAFDIEAADYLLKPVRPGRLADAIARILRKLAEPAVPGEAVEPDETIAVELGGVTRYVKRSEVAFAEAQRDYVRLHTRDKGYLVRTPLAGLEERWADAGFVRVHRRFLVNAAFVDSLRSQAGRVTVELAGGGAVPVSRRYASQVRAALVRAHRLDREAP